MAPSFPSTVGDYQIVRLIGRGGMGAVYEGLHQKIGHRAAIKTLLPDYANNKEIIARFFNEACAVNAIKHPGIVQISDLGETSDGGVYLVMEYLEGETLLARVRQQGGRLSEDAVVRIGWQLASTLSAAHSKGIIHRDLKPANLMVVPDPAGPGGERIKVLDFGIAKLANSAVQTRTGQIMGTLAYMSPEQISTPSRVSGPSDVYSLGAMLYHVLAGTPPFVSKGNELALLSMHLSEEPPPLRSLVPGISTEMETLLARTLSKEPEARPTMVQLAEQWERWDTKATARFTSQQAVPRRPELDEAKTAPVGPIAANASWKILRMPEGNATQMLSFGTHGGLHIEFLSFVSSEAHELISLPFDLSGLTPVTNHPLMLSVTNHRLELRVAKAVGNTVRFYSELTSAAARSSYALPAEVSGVPLFIGHHRGPHYGFTLTSRTRSVSWTDRLHAEVSPFDLDVEAPQTANRLLLLHRVGEKNSESHLVCVAIKET